MASLVSLLALTTIGLAAFGVGRTLLRFMALEDDGDWSMVVWSTALGLVVCGTGLALLGLVGLLYEPLIAVGSAAAGLWGVVEAATCATLARQRAAHGRRPRQGAENWPIPSRWAILGGIVLPGVAAAASLIAALAPPTAGDALCYHLELPKRFLLEHRLVSLPDHDNATFPLLVEMWYLWALALDGGVAAQLVHWAVGILLGLATVMLARMFVPRSWAWLSGAALLAVPGVSNQMTAPLNDLSVAFFATLTLVAWRHASHGDQNPRWFVISGMMLGGALATKYVALVTLAALGVAWICDLWRADERRQWLVQGAVVVLFVAGVASSGWYIRAVIEHGNPIHPFLSRAPVEPVRGILVESKAALGRNPAALPLAPWAVTMHPERFGGRGHQLGPMFLAGLPALAVARRLRGLQQLALFAAAHGVLWFFLRQNSRFLLPIVPPLTVGLVWVWIEMRRWPSPCRRICYATLALLAALGPVAAIARVGNYWRVALGIEDRAAYLLRVEPSFRAAAVAREMIRPTAHLLSQDYRAYYFPCRVTREHSYRRRTGYDCQLDSPDKLSSELRRRGFTHLLLVERLDAGGPPFDPTLSRLVEAELAVSDQGIYCLSDYACRDPDGRRRRYRLMMLLPKDGRP